jgi:hypothetical protein
MRSFVIAICCLLAAGPLYAGGGSENYLLVVNSASADSLAIANHYIALRDIPSSNVMHIAWKGDLHTIDVETFRKQILQPIVQTAHERGLTAHLDGVVYSSDFPYSIDFTADVPERDRKVLQDPKNGMTPTGSINSLTYYYHYVLTRQPFYVDIRQLTNLYFRPVNQGKQLAPTQGFRGWCGWGSNGQRLEAGGQRFLLSMMLGVTAGKGNTVDEVVRYLQRSAKADGAPPQGTIYFTKTDDPRSTPRHPWFDPAVAELKKLGVAAEVLETDIPTGKNDIAGGMFGAAAMDWGRRKNTILPGAMVDDLTSFGAEFKNNSAGQTLLSDFLRAGAAGSSGTAVEPLNHPIKFPLPYLHVHYARGCTLAEAFYQSVGAPYQLVIVGDPLCRPWAKIPKINVAGVTAEGALSGKVSIKPSAEGGSAEVDRFEIYLDGSFIGHCVKNETFELDTAAHSDGAHELRVVGIESGPIESQGRAILPVTFANHGRTMTFSASAGRVVLGKSIRLSAKAPGARQIIFYSAGRELGRASGASGAATIDTDTLGAGPVTLRAIGLGKGGAEAHVLAAPILLRVDPKR